jgi:hypothetical protein
MIELRIVPFGLLDQNNGSTLPLKSDIGIQWQNNNKVTPTFGILDIHLRVGFKYAL